MVASLVRRCASGVTRWRPARASRSLRRCCAFAGVLRLRPSRASAQSQQPAALSAAAAGSRSAPAPQSDAPMLVQAREIKYDYTNNSVSAVGNVQIYYSGSTIEADEVIYDQNTKRLQRERQRPADRSRRQDHLRPSSI